MGTTVSLPSRIGKTWRRGLFCNIGSLIIHSFESDDGISRQEAGSLKEVVDEENKPQTVIVVKGTYSYPGEDGKPVVVSYVADETGFHAEGDSIPKAA